MMVGMDAKFGLGLWSRRQALAAAPALAAAACGGPAPDLLPGEKGRVVRVSDGDLIALDTGLRVRLAEIEAPSRPYRDRAGEPFADDAAAVLEDVVLGRRCQLFYGGLARDRYDRAIAHVIVEDELGGKVWANGLQVRRGAARVRTWPDNSARAAQLLALEAEARGAGRGLWASPHFAPCQPEDLLRRVGRFTLVEGRARLLEDQSAENGVCMADRDDHLALRLGARLRRLGPPPQPGAPIRVRGRVRTDDDTPAMIELTHWAQIEVLSA